MINLVETAEACDLREYTRAWARHRIYFNSSCDAEIVHGPSVLFVRNEALLYRFPHRYHESEKRGMQNDRFLDPNFFLHLNNGQYRSSLLIACIDHIYRTEGFSFSLFLSGITRFLDAVPKTVRCGISMENSEYLLPDYFSALRERNVVHVLSDHPAIPPLLEHCMMPNILTADRAVVRVRDLTQPETLLGVVHMVRRCLDEQKPLSIDINQDDAAFPLAFLRLMELMNDDLAKLSSLRQRHAA